MVFFIFFFNEMNKTCIWPSSLILVRMEVPSPEGTLIVDDGSCMMLSSFLIYLLSSWFLNFLISNFLNLLVFWFFDFLIFFYFLISGNLIFWICWMLSSFHRVCPINVVIVKGNTGSSVNDVTVTVPLLLIVLHIFFSFHCHVNFSCCNCILKL